MYDYLPSGECVASAFLALPNRTRQTGTPGSVPALSATRKLIEQPNNFLVTIYKKCKGSGLFYGPLAVRGSPSGMGLFGQTATGCQWGSTVHPWGTFCFSCCFPYPCVCAWQAQCACCTPLTPGPLPQKHGSELLLSTRSRGFVSRDFSVRPHTHLNVQVSNKE